MCRSLYFAMVETNVYIIECIGAVDENAYTIGSYNVQGSMSICIYKLLILLILKLNNLQLYKLKLHYGNHIIRHLFVGTFLLLMIDYLWML
jgi:hypothetical protein